MKQMTCQQLGGACDAIFAGNSFEEIAEQSQQHGMEMMQKGDAAHLSAMREMQQLMKDPAAFSNWYEEKKRLFESLPE